MRGEYKSRIVRCIRGLELPPRARRILFSPSRKKNRVGTTSACAENTDHGDHRLQGLWNYLRVRGEYIRGCGHEPLIMELPPRARRILPSPCHRRSNSGTTSACAENTYAGRYPCGFSGNYLRVRGEYQHAKDLGNDESELPPRARRILSSRTKWGRSRGTTSACAENTSHYCSKRSSGRNYLRVRGEYSLRVQCRWNSEELPPRARRIHAPRHAIKHPQGTTSACAENTTTTYLEITWQGNYLRVRGEYPHTSTRISTLSELPPRARRIP